MINPEIIFQPNKTKSITKVFIEEVNSSRKLNSKLENQVQQNWQEVLNEAEEKGRLAYDNENTYRYEGIDQKTGRTIISASKISFSTRYSLTKLDLMYDLDESYWSKGLFQGGLVKTSDNYFVFGKKSNVSLSSTNLSEKKIDPVGGVLDREIEQDNKYLYKMMLEELSEELGVEEKDLKEISFLGLVRSRLSFIGIIVLATLKRNKSDIESNFKEKSDDEFKSLLFVKEGELESFLYKLEDYRPLIWKLYSNINK